MALVPYDPYRSEALSLGFLGAGAQTAYNYWDYLRDYASGAWRGFSRGAREYLRGNPDYQDGPLPRAIRRVADRARREVGAEAQRLLEGSNSTSMSSAPYAQAFRRLASANATNARRESNRPRKAPGGAMYLGRPANINMGGKNLSLGGFQGLQLKFIDATFSSSPVASGTVPIDLDPSDLHLTPVPLGTGPSERTSNRIFLKSLQVMGTVLIRQNTVSGTPADFAFANMLQATVPMKVYVVLDTQTNGSQVIPGEVWDVRTPVGSMVSQNLRNMSFVDRLKVLHVVDICVPCQSVVRNYSDSQKAVSRGVASFNLFLPLKGIVQKYEKTASTGAIAGVIDNSLHLFFALENTQTAVTNVLSCEIQGVARARYFDG